MLFGGYGPDARSSNIYQLHYGHAPMIPALRRFTSKSTASESSRRTQNHIGVVLRSNMRPVIRYVLKGDEKSFFSGKRAAFMILLIQQ